MATRVRVITAALAVLTAAGCSSSGADRPAEPPPALGTVATITEPGQIALPIDDYLVTTAQVRQIVKAQDLLAAECLRGYGLTGRPTVLVGLEDMVAGRLTRSLVYGYFDVANAGSKGYAAVRNATPPPPGAPLDEATADRNHIALTGADPRTGQPVTTLDGKPVPAGGCQQKSREALGGATPNPDTGDLPEGGPKVPAGDPRLVDAFAKWSACMKEKGFEYKDPGAAIGDPAWQQQTAQPSPQEIATASADIACKLAHNTVGIAVAVQTAYAKRYVEANAAKLTAYKQRTDDMLRKAAELTAAAPAVG
ncbi:hypothetical protein ACIRBX_07320 [Kitasatospora sp. NPDC096147]|uniref:hypothetical protein n=1 Tax=Kitasatospora sp. NPDC096147 TaxID=3364093 RepID=UPI003802831A